MLCSVARAASLQTKGSVDHSGVSVKLGVLHAALSDICHSLAYCGFTHTEKTLCTDLNGEAALFT